jgi:hypothetical protein
MRHITVYPEVVWNHEVDVVCTDVGLAGLLCAVSAATHGAKVMLAAQPRHSRPWFDTVRGDAATTAYLSELSADIDTMDTSDTSGGIAQADPAVLPARRVRPYQIVTTGKRRRVVPPFDGGLLRRWTAECIASATGYLYTRVTNWPSEQVQTSDGDLLEVTECAVPAAVTGDHEQLVGWLTAQAARLGVHAQPVEKVERLVFDETGVGGVVFGTSDGPWAVRARHGVLMCGTDEVQVVEPGERLAMVGRAASRFGRVEMLAPG